MFVLAVISGITAPFTLSAKAESVMEFEQNNVMDDLENSVINGEEFSLKNYNFDTSKNTQVISFLEYSYSFYESLQGNFGLYVYVYNPQGLKFVVNSSLHSISFKIGEDESKSYSKYPLSVVNFSQETDYYGLFYKLKVVFTDTQKQAILKELNSTERVYSVSEVELQQDGQTNATAIHAQGIYKYSGYMSGFGSDSSAESTLKCTTEHLETLHLEPQSTVYRPEGTNGKNDYTQDSLHSVYFAVSNAIIEKYGEMTAVHATWLNAVLAPALVTGNESAYKAIKKYLGQALPQGELAEVVSYHNVELGYMYLGAVDTVLVNGMGTHYLYNCGFSYNSPCSFNNENGTLSYPNFKYYGGPIESLYMIFDSGRSADSADSYIVKSEDIYGELKTSATKYASELINGKYAACMFESVDENFTELEIERDDEYDLTSETITQNWWQKLWGTGTVVSNTFDGIKAIYNVSDSDFTGNIEADCNNLYIGSQDYADFKQYYEDNKIDSTVYLFRYQVSDYISQEATLFEVETNWLGIKKWSEVDTNAYFFQQTVNLDFDIIDVTFSTGETETVIPVVMSPIDVIPDGTSPVYTESDEMQEEWWQKIMALLLGVALLAFIMPFLAPIISSLFMFILKGVLNIIKIALKIVIFVITLPLRPILWLFKKK